MLNPNLNPSQKGFTLIELLVVIAIVAILAVVVILTLNPAELLRQARDSNRIQDLNTLNSAISQYLADVSSPSITSSSVTCFTSAATSTGIASNCGFAGTYTTINATTSRAINGTGWIQINFGSMSAGSPLGQLPIDPINTGTNTVYRYVASSTALTFKLKAYLESTKYGNPLGSATTTPAATDGGTDNAAYEVGTNLSM